MGFLFISFIFFNIASSILAELPSNIRDCFLSVLKSTYVELFDGLWGRSNISSSLSIRMSLLISFPTVLNYAPSDKSPPSNFPATGK